MMDPYKAFAVVAVAGAAGSLLIVLIALRTLDRITDGGMWAIAGMAAAPAIMTVGVSYFINRTRGPGSPGGPA